MNNVVPINKIADDIAKTHARLNTLREGVTTLDAQIEKLEKARASADPRDVRSIERDIASVKAARDVADGVLAEAAAQAKAARDAYEEARTESLKGLQGTLTRCETVARAFDKSVREAVEALHTLEEEARGIELLVQSPIRRFWDKSAISNALQKAGLGEFVPLMPASATEAKSLVDHLQVRFVVSARECAGEITNKRRMAAEAGR